MARKPLLMMRTRNLAGPGLARHHGVPGLSRSVGSFIQLNVPVEIDIVTKVAARLTAEGWTIEGLIPNEEFRVIDTGDVITKVRIDNCDVTGLDLPLAVDLEQAIVASGGSCP